MNLTLNESIELDDPRCPTEKGNPRPSRLRGCVVCVPSRDLYGAGWAQGWAERFEAASVDDCVKEGEGLILALSALCWPEQPPYDTGTTQHRGSGGKSLSVEPRDDREDCAEWTIGGRRGWVLDPMESDDPLRFPREPEAKVRAAESDEPADDEITDEEVEAELQASGLDWDELSEDELNEKRRCTRRLLRSHDTRPRTLDAGGRILEPRWIDPTTSAVDLPEAQRRTAGLDNRGCRPVAYELEMVAFAVLDIEGVNLQVAGRVPSKRTTNKQRREASKLAEEQQGSLFG